MAESIHRLKRDCSDQQVKTICEQMVQAFGGIEGLVSAWKQCWETDFGKQRARSFAHLEAIVRLMQWVEANKPDYSQLSDEELEQAVAAVRVKVAG